MTPPSMSAYRHQTPEEQGFANEAEELDALRQFVQELMFDTGQANLADSVLIITKICEFRSFFELESGWYAKMAILLRQVLEQIDAPFPKDKLELDFLYYPDLEQTH